MHRILLVALLWCLATGAQAASTIIPGLLPVGVPPNSGLINQNFQNAANDVNALQTQNAGVTAPSNPSLGYLWLSTPQNSTTFTDNTWDGHAWVPTGAFDSVNHIWMPPIGGGIPPTIMSATTTDLGSVPQAVVYVSGGNPIQSFGSRAPVGTTKIVDFLAVTTLTNNASVLLLPGAANITTAPGDTLFATQVASGKWVVTAYTRAAGGSGIPIIGPLSSVVGDCAAWNNTSGTLLSDTGHPCALGTVVGPSTSITGDCATWNNTLGTLLADAGQCSITANNNDALSAIASTAAKSVARLGVITAGDASPLVFISSSIACSLNSGTGDGGSQVPSSDGKCWLASFPATGADVREWGVVVLPTCCPVDSRTALQAAFAWASSNSGKLVFPQGIVYLASQATATLAASGSITIEGQGPDSSFIQSGAGVSAIGFYEDGVTNQSFHVRDLGFLAGGGALSTPATALGVNNGGHFIASAQSDVSNVTFRGADGYGNVSGQVKCWTNGFFTDSVSDINFINDNFSGCHSSTGMVQNGAIGITIFGSAAASIIYNITDCNFSFLQNGIFYGENVQGVNVAQSNFTPDWIGVYVPTGDGGTFGLAVTNSQFGSLQYGVYAGNNFLPEINFVGNQVGGGVGDVVYIALGSGVVINGNVFQDFGELGSPPGSGELAINIVADDGNPIVISGNVFMRYNSFSVVPVTLGASTSSVRFASNGFIGTQLVASASPFNYVTGNQIAYSTVSGAANNGSGLTRLTVTSAAPFHDGDMVIADGVGGTEAATSVTSNIQVIDSTHVDLLQILWGSSTYTGGGTISWLP